MKLVLATSLAAMLAVGISGTAEAHGYPSPARGSIYWADGNVAIGLNYGAPYVAPYYVPPRYVYRPRVYYPRGHYHDKHHGYHKGYSSGYRKGDKHHRWDDRRGRHGRDRWDD